MENKLTTPKKMNKAKRWYLKRTNKKQITLWQDRFLKCTKN